jgi:exonuclease VII small subunit
MSKTKISYDAKVKRAAELLKMCNQILRDTEKNVGDLIKDLGL